MEIKNIQNKIKEAIEYVKDVNEPFKIPAFEIILNRLLDEIKNTSTHAIVTKEIHVKQIEKSIGSNLEELARKCNITIEQLNDLIVLKDDGTAELLIKLGNDL